jgi:hypothetical protein
MNFVVKKLIESKMKDVPVEQREQIMAMIEKNPGFFESLVKEIQEQITNGKDQMTATMEVLKTHEAELREIATK